MKIAKAAIVDKQLFKKVKAAINRMYYAECRLCGAIRVEATELTRVLHSLIDNSEKANNRLNDFCSYFLGQIIESEPEEFASFEEFEKWEAAHKRTVYHFLDTDDCISEIYGSYDELVIFYNPTCDCFDKGKIQNEIVFDY
ncbi:MAG: hypothetical protein ABFD82_16480 [Syntrophaceae bacterium]